jgi:tRNA threonylcarbamoyladenosine biosynthesis protein TsaB
VRILGIETSTPVVSVALLEDRQITAEASFHTRQDHMKRLLPLVDQLLDGAGCSVRDLDAFSVALGPGSFTSLRIGLATGKALAHALGKPLIGVPTLDVLAWDLHGIPELICPVLISRRQEVYAAFYTTSGSGMQRLSGYLALDPLRLAERLSGQLHGVVTFTGEGALQYWELFHGQLGERAKLVEPVHIWPRAGIVAWLGAERLNKSEDADPARITALYVKQPVIRNK